MIHLVKYGHWPKWGSWQARGWTYINGMQTLVDVKQCTVNINPGRCQGERVRYI